MKSNGRLSNKGRWGAGMILLVAMIAAICLSGGSVLAATPIDLYTTNINLAASPGQSVNYNVEVINRSQDIQKVGLHVEDLPNDWEYTVTSGGWSISELAIKPDETADVSFKVTVPLAVEKGAYRLALVTDQGATLPLTINITEQGTFRTALTTDQPNLEGSSDASFTYTVKLDNKTADQQTYALRADSPAGWDVKFSSAGKNVSSVVIEPNTNQSLTVSVTPAANVTAQKYTIPIEAASGSTGAKLELEAVITGTYDLQLTTSNDLLSTDLTASGSKKVELMLKNTGSTELSNVSLSSTTPSGWDVTFEQKDKISIKAGESKSIVATITSSDKAIAGDYVVGITARSPEVSKTMSMRVAVKTSVLWGWLGILIIALVFGAIYYLFRKYGRR